MNVVDIEEALAELTNQPFVPNNFILGFMAAYGAPKATLARLKSGDGNSSDIPTGMLWKKWLHFAPAKLGEITSALDRIEASKKTGQGKVRYAVTSDGKEFGARDLRTGEALFCALSDLDNHFGFFLPIAGIDRYEIADENPIDIKATGKLARLYDALIADNSDWNTDAHQHAMHQLMIRLIFCLFGEDTGIFPDHLFSETIVNRCDTNPANVAPTLEMLFEVMNLNDKDESRKGKPDWACKFPYVNGGLFIETHPCPKFSRTALRYLIEAGRLDWKVINPDIFGSMIQTIVNAEERGELGMHYTSVPNILKVLNPLFLDGLRESIESNWNNKKGLQDILKRLTKIRVFDPACGSGNFLVIAYREMREIEIGILKRLQALTGQMVGIWSHVELRNFYGIELRDFASETAKLALWIAQHQMNKRHESEFGAIAAELPLKSGGQIVCGNSLRLSWETVCPSSQDIEEETYICSNPPYLGSVYQTSDQKQDMKLLMTDRIESFKDLDYVACWFIKSADYMRAIGGTAAFVSTNSLCQGEQVPMLWAYLFAQRLCIQFAHQSFKWRNNAANSAAVMCVVIGLAKHGATNKTIYTEKYAKRVGNIGPYLIEMGDIFVRKRSSPLSAVARMIRGNQPTDNGNLILSLSERDSLLEKYPEAHSLIKLLIGSKEFIRGEKRWCLWITDDLLELAQGIPEINARIEAVRKVRKASKGKQANDNAATPHKFAVVTGVCSRDSIIIPKVSSERRHYLPVGLAGADTIISDLAFALYDAPLWNLSLIASRLHLVWIAAVCGQLETRYRYSNTLGWNTFPVPNLNDEDKQDLTNRAQDILLAREAHFPATIAELYDPDKMPKELLEAHRANDEAIEKIYIGRSFKNDSERLEHLFKLYTKLAGALDVL